MRRALAGALAAAALLAGAAGAGAAPGGAVNLRATPATKQQLRAAFLAHLSGPVARSGVRGPLPGTTYYARHRGVEWALATFSLRATGPTDQPERFRRGPGGRWVDLGDTGDPCPSQVPAAVLRVWAYPGCG